MTNDGDDDDDDDDMNDHKMFRRIKEISFF